MPRQYTITLTLTPDAAETMAYALEGRALEFQQAIARAKADDAQPYERAGDEVIRFWQINADLLRATATAIREQLKPKPRRQLP